VGIKEKKKISQNGDPTSNKRAVRVRWIEQASI
jgi:hypothetical protein